MAIQDRGPDDGSAPADWMWTVEDSVGERVNDALRLWVEGLEDSLARGGAKQTK